MYGGLSVEALAVWRAEGVKGSITFNWLLVCPPPPRLHRCHPHLVRVWSVDFGLSGLGFGFCDDLRCGGEEARICPLLVCPRKHAQIHCGSCFIAS